MLLTWLLSCALAVPVCIAADVTIGFEREHYTVGEEEGRVEVCAAVLKGELQGAEQVLLTIDAITGEGDDADSQDFTPISGQLQFTSDMQRMCVDIEILDDEYIENNETFTAVMLGFAATLAPHEATIRIVDNDALPVISVTTNTPVVSEDVIMANVTVSLLKGVVSQPIVLQLFTVDGTSTAPVDYTPVNNNITLSSNVTEAHLSISVVDDQRLEYDEQLFVILHLLSVSLQDVTLSGDNLSITIMDNDVVTVGFDYEIYNVTENEKRVVVCVRLFEGITEREFTVNATVISNRTATDLDYSLPRIMMLLFNETTSLSCLDIEVTDDLVFELSEQFTLQLYTSTTFIMLNPDTATVNIADNDVVTVGFDSEIYNVTENEGRVVVCVRLFEGITEREFTVNAVVNSGSTTATDLDYSLPQSTVLLFSTTTLLSCLDIEVTRDVEFERSEYFTLKLYTSTTFVILSPNTATVNIADGDGGTVPSCPPEMLFTASGSYSWLTTLAGSTATLPCPIGPSAINATRQCNAQGNWLNHDASLCLDEFDLILTESITIETYEALLEQLYSTVQRAVPSEQNAENVESIALFFNAMADLLLANTTVAVSQKVVANTVGIISIIQNWPPETMRDQGSNIVRSVESIFQSVVTRGNFTLLNVLDTNLAFWGERINTTDFLIKGRSFLASRSGAAGNITITVGTSNNNALTELDISSFSLSSGGIDINETAVNFVFTFYRESTLFPVEKNRNSTIATPVLGAFLPNVDTTSLNYPANIHFRLNQTMNVANHTCVSWNFSRNDGLGGWSPEGCDIVINESDSSVVMCSCSHLTNFAVLVDICSRTGCDPIPSELALALDILSIIGVSMSLFGVVATVITLLGFKKLRERDTTKFHVQLCAALFCMLLVFVIGIDHTEIYGGCVAVSVLIHYFTLVSVMWMGAEAILMFQKLVIVFIQITTKYIIAVSIICWSMPLIPVVIPLAVNTNFMVSFNGMGGLQFCFIGNTAVFFGAFLGPILAIILFNVVILVVVIFVLVKHTFSSSRRVKNDSMDTKTTLRLVFSISGVMFLFGLTWLFGALTVTGATLAFQILFAVFNSLQGFFIFVLFCIFSRDARELWKETLSCGYYRSSILHHSSTLHPSRTKSNGSSMKRKPSDLTMTSYSTPTHHKTVPTELSEDASGYTDEKSQQSIGDSTTDTLVSSTTLDEQKLSNEEKEKADLSKAYSPEANSWLQVPDGDSSLTIRVRHYSTKKYKYQVKVVEMD